MKREGIRLILDSMRFFSSEEAVFSKCRSRLHEIQREEPSERAPLQRVQEPLVRERIDRQNIVGLEPISSEVFKDLKLKWINRASESRDVGLSPT